MAYKVAVDASNNNFSSNGITENDYTFDIAKYINDRLNNLGIESFLVRSENNSLTDEENKETVLITVKDYAGGIDEKIVPFVFKNILTTKGTNGTGLGLYLVYSIVKGEFNGDITFDTKVGEGTTFYIRLPKA